MTQKSMVDVAYEYAQQFEELIPFKALWQHVVEELGFSEDEAKAKIGIFYTNLSLDSRFHCESDNTWILRSKLLFDVATKNTFLVDDDTDNDMEEEDEYEEDDEENEEEDESSLEADDDDETLNSNMYNNDDDDDEEVM